MKKLIYQLKHKDAGAIGIGAMIVFIAMVLVAGIAASVLIQTSTRLESQAMHTGQTTTDEVATGLAVYDVEGQVLAAAGTEIDKLAIMVRPRAGSQDIDLSQAVVEISDGSNKYILTYAQGQFQPAPATAGVFSTSSFTLTADDFGIIELEDADNSCAAATPVINRGDKVFITVNATATMSSIGERIDIWGRIVPEHGAPGIIAFRTPASYSDTIYDLQ